METLATYRLVLETKQIENAKSIIRNFLSNIFDASSHDIKKFAILLKSYGVKMQSGTIYLDETTNPVIKQYCINKVIDQLILRINRNDVFPLHFIIKNIVCRPSLEFAAALRSTIFNMGYVYDIKQIINELGTINNYLFTSVYNPTNHSLDLAASNPVVVGTPNVHLITSKCISLIYNNFDRYISKNIKIDKIYSPEPYEIIVKDCFAQNDLTQLDKNIDDVIKYLGSIEEHLTGSYCNDVKLLSSTYSYVKSMLNMIVCKNILIGSPILIKWFEINGITNVNGNIIMTENTKANVEQIRQKLLNRICNKILSTFETENSQKISLTLYEIYLNQITYRLDDYILNMAIDWLKTNGYEKAEYEKMPNGMCVINIDVIIDLDKVILQEFMGISRIKSAKVIDKHLLIVQ
jgi:hypothetical protein